ncbi:SDR family NAD(P)-dependent oxidoreductase [Nostoc sp. PCC 9305]|uniref:SDR family NAD(P)-dependent oxidoreductase n=1 Tax=Nostoc sp. PCC 9305 TaxID=296636 RepID=UPI0039C701AD
MKKLEGKIAVVTGASKGIGASIAKHLAAEGAAVVVNYSSSKEGADRVVAEILSEGGKAIARSTGKCCKKGRDRTSFCRDAAGISFREGNHFARSAFKLQQR